MSFITIIVALGCLAVGCIIGYATFRYIIDKQYKESMAKAERDTEVLKEKKLLEVKEKFLNKKSELEKEVQQRNHKFSAERKPLKAKRNYAKSAARRNKSPQARNRTAATTCR